MTPDEVDDKLIRLQSLLIEAKSILSAIQDTPGKQETWAFAADLVDAANTIQLFAIRHRSAVEAKSRLRASVFIGLSRIFDAATKRAKTGAFPTNEEAELWIDSVLENS